MPAKRLLALLLVCTSPAAVPREADTPWLTVVGDASNAGAETIQIDPRPLYVKGQQRRMTVRLNRAKDRTSTDGIRFRSFNTEIEFDCGKREARFTRTQFFEGPLWTQPGKLMVYPPSMVRPMAFREFEPNPRDRVIAAACGVKRSPGP